MKAESHRKITESEAPECDPESSVQGKGSANFIYLIKKATKFSMKQPNFETFFFTPSLTNTGSLSDAGWLETDI